MNWKRHIAAVLSIAALTGALMSVIVWRPIEEFLAQQISHPIQFRARAALGKSPGLAPQIKSILFDDQFVNHLDRSDLRLAEWATLLRAIDSAGAKQIYIDKLFSIPQGMEDVSRFTKQTSQLSSDVIAGAWLVPHEIKSKETLVSNRKEFLETSWPGAMPNSSSSNLYGPHKRVLEAFSHLGHLQYDGSGYVDLFLSSNSHQVIPQLTVYADRNLATTLATRQLVNLPDAEELYDRSYSALGIWRAVQAKKSLSPAISPGDIVVILPAMYTGHTDWVETPLGSIPGGFVQVGVLNSLLNANVIQEKLPPLVAIWIGIALVAGLAILRQAWLFMSAASAIIVAQVATGILVFSYASISLPWLAMSLSSALATIGIFMRRYYLVQRRAFQLKKILSGAIPAERIEDLVNEPEKYSVKPRGQIVTVMFIDIVGFSIHAENRPPREVFVTLRSIINDLADRIHKHGGVVDKILGDGLLCFFGYEYANDSGHESHADQALKCAIEIQRSSLSKELADGELVFRIGINTTPVFIGDLRDHSRLDPTVIGSGVNLAKRLEEACDDYRINIGLTTKEMLTAPENLSIPTYKRRFAIKHHIDALEAFEVDPVSDQNERRNEAVKELSSRRGLARVNQRFLVHCPEQLVISVHKEDVQLLNYSFRGLLISMPSYWGRNADIIVNLEPGGEEVRASLVQAGIQSLLCEVRWGVPADKRFFHGLTIKNLSDEQATCLLDVLHRINETSPNKLSA